MFSKKIKNIEIVDNKNLTIVFDNSIPKDSIILNIKDNDFSFKELKKSKIYKKNGDSVSLNFEHISDIYDTDCFGDSYRKFSRKIIINISSLENLFILNSHHTFIKEKGAFSIPDNINIHTQYPIVFSKLISKKININIDHSMTSFNDCFFEELNLNTTNTYTYCRNSVFYNANISIKKGLVNFDDSSYVFNLLSGSFEPYENKTILNVLNFIDNSKLAISKNTEINVPSDFYDNSSNETSDFFVNQFDELNLINRNINKDELTQLFLNDFNGFKILNSSLFKHRADNIFENIKKQIKITEQKKLDFYNHITNDTFNILKNSFNDIESLRKNYINFLKKIHNTKNIDLNNDERSLFITIRVLNKMVNDAEQVLLNKKNELNKKEELNDCIRILSSNFIINDIKENKKLFFKDIIEKLNIYKKDINLTSAQLKNLKIICLTYDFKNPIKENELVSF